MNVWLGLIKQEWGKIRVIVRKNVIFLIECVFTRFRTTKAEKIVNIVVYLHFDIAETDPTPLKKFNAKISSFLPPRLPYESEYNQCHRNGIQLVF